MKHLFLFDVDGVLVKAGGYLRALQDTVAHFSRQMGVGEHPPTEAEVRALEAYGLTSEWDSAPTCVAALLIERLRRERGFPLPARWLEALPALGAHPLPLPHPDYAALAAAIGARAGADQEISQTARAVLWDAAPDLPGSQQSAVAGLLDTLLGHPYDFDRAPVMRHFQHLAIGSDGVAATYGAAPQFECRPYLLEHDAPELDDDVRERLRAAVAAEQIRAVIYTARPSLPPADAGGSRLGFSPEAEQALALVRLVDWPLIGLGRLQWLEQRTGEKASRMVKPSPVQALAAIGAAASGREAAALEAAFAFHYAGELRSPLSDLGPTTVHVFEDSPTGLAAVHRAVEALQAAGIAIDWKPYGITPAEDAKSAAMAAQGVPIYRTVNEAVGVALGGCGERGAGCVKRGT